MDIIGDSFDTSAQSLSMDLLDTDVFFSTEQLGVGELDMAGLTDVDLANLDSNLDNKLGDTEQQIENWSNTVEEHLRKIGFEQGRASGNIYHHKGAQVGDIGVRR